MQADAMMHQRDFMAEIDVRDININVAATLQQEQQTQSF